VNLPFLTSPFTQARRPPRASRWVRGRPSGRVRRGRLARPIVLGLLIAAGLVAATVGGWVLVGGDVAGLVSAAGVSWLFGLSPTTTGADTGEAGQSAPVLTVTSQPAGARVLIDGRERGKTPLSMLIVPGAHTVSLQRSDALDEVRHVTVDAAGRTLDVLLWRKQPDAVKLRAPYPGATVFDARFLLDGRVALTLALPSRSGTGLPGLREAWLLDPASASVAPFTAPTNVRAAAVAVSPDGQRLAYLQQAPLVKAGAGPTTPPYIPNRLDEVWVASTTATLPLARVFHLPAPTPGTGYSPPEVERLADVSWAPDGRHLLVATQLGDLAGGAATRSRLLLLDADHRGQDAAYPPPSELVTMPAEVVPGSYDWAPDGHWVAFLARAAAAPGGKGLLTLDAVDIVADPVAGAFRYLADVGRADATTAAPLPAAAVAWEPGTEPGSHTRLLYVGPVANPSAASAGPFGLLGLGATASDTTTALFSTTPVAPGLAPDTRRRVGSSTGLLAPVWRMPTTETPSTSVLALARSEDNGKPLAVRAIDPADGRTHDTGARLPTSVAPAVSTVGARWDSQRGRALLFSRPSSGNRVLLGTPGSDTLDVWLVTFTGSLDDGGAHP